MIKYICDKCGKEMPSNAKINITFSFDNYLHVFGNQADVSYLLCEKCAEDLIKAIEGDKNDNED